MAMHLSRRTLLGLSALLAAPALAAAGVLRLISYHNQPPFMGTESTGLTFDLADYLEARLGAPVAAEIIPRNRLDSELLTAGNGFMVPWVSPTWFPPKLLAQMTFSPALLTDQNIVISHAKKPIEYAGAASLIGYRMGIVTGRVHRDIDRLVADGKIKVSNARTPQLNLAMLSSERVDFVIMPAATWHALVPVEQRRHFYVATQAQEVFTRHIMLPTGANVLIDKVSSIVTAMDTDTIWHRILQAYDLDEPAFSPLPT